MQNSFVFITQFFRHDQKTLFKLYKIPKSQNTQYFTDYWHSPDKHGNQKKKLKANIFFTAIVKFSMLSLDAEQREIERIFISFQNTSVRRSFLVPGKLFIFTAKIANKRFRINNRAYTTTRYKNRSVDVNI